MVTDSSLQRILVGVSSLGDNRYLVNLASLVLCLDVVVATQYKVGLGEVSVDWVRANVSLGGAVIFLLGYVFLRAFLLPTIVGLYVVALGLPLFAWFYKNNAFEDHVAERRWLEYAILTRNTPAYRELEAKRKKKEEQIEDMRAGFSLLVLVAVNTIVEPGRTISGHVVDFIRHASTPVSWLCIIALSTFLLLLLIAGLLAPFGALDEYGIKVKADTLREEIRRVLKGGSA